MKTILPCSLKKSRDYYLYVTYGVLKNEKYVVVVGFPPFFSRRQSSDERNCVFEESLVIVTVNIL